MMLFRHAKKSIDYIDSFLNLIDQGSILFKE
jgi:hypothetical protein